MSPDATAKDWFYLKPGVPREQQVGPLGWEQLRSLAQAGTLAPNDLVWNPTLPQWLPAAQIVGLCPTTATAGAQSASASAAPPPPPTEWAAARSRAAYQPSAAPPGSYPAGPRRSWLLPLVISLVVLVLIGGGLGAYFGFIRDGDNTASTVSTAGGKATTTSTGVTTTARATTTVSATTTTTEAPAAWTDLRPSGDVPSARMSHSMVYDSANATVILFGGTFKGENELTSFNDTWAYDPPVNMWTDLSPAGSLPAARDSHAMVYDSDSGKVILFGGWAADGACLKDTWAYDPVGNTWTDLDPAGDQPPARFGHSMVYDPDSGKVILFGGTDYYNDFNDTWAYDPAANAWTYLDPAGSSPAARESHAMVYASRSGTVILFGGSGTNGTSLNDTWAYDPAANTWTELDPTDSVPSVRSGHAMAYDPESGKVILFGGWGDEGFLNDMWTYEPVANAWTKLDPSVSVPPVRAFQSMVHDSADGSVILFGGYDRFNGVHFNDTWAYGY